MHYEDIVTPRILHEAKARIDHPEDLVLVEGSAGARRALAAMIHAAERPHTVSIKWDGSPAVIFGRSDDSGMVLTDKSGFSSKKPGGMPTTADAVQQMLFMRKPNDSGREQYADSIARLYPLLNASVPASYRGYLQGDVLWTSTPPIQNGNFVFTPNKIKYSIPSDSALGEKIAHSSAGIVIHSEFANQSDSDSKAISNVDRLGLNAVPGLVIMGPEIRDLQHTHISESLKNALLLLINRSAFDVDAFLNHDQLRLAQLSDLGSKLKQYVAQRASHGLPGLLDAAHGFVHWLSSVDSKLTERKQANIATWIDQHRRGYEATWAIADQLSKLKDLIRKDVDKQVNTSIGAVLHDQHGHEGYVADTPDGKIKFVNRPHFMRKDGII